MKLIIIKQTVFNKKNVRLGDAIEADDKVAMTLVHAGKAILHTKKNEGIVNGFLKKLEAKELPLELVSAKILEAMKEKK